MSNFLGINLAHPQQDVHKVRRERTGHIRYRLATLLLPQGTSGTPLLEIGCGRCEFAQQLRERFNQVTVADLNPTSIDHARALGFEAYQQDLNQGNASKVTLCL